MKKGAFILIEMCVWLGRLAERVNGGVRDGKKSSAAEYQMASSTVGTPP